jgi:hypothetical protein
MNPTDTLHETEQCQTGTGIASRAVIKKCLHMGLWLPQWVALYRSTGNISTCYLHINWAFFLNAFFTLSKVFKTYFI